MALITCDFYSESLGLCCAMNVILPQATSSQIGMQGSVRAKKHPVLWLLHGLSDDHTIWARRTSIERYVAERGIAVVMPNAGKSFYKNMASGPAYGTFLKEELPEIAQSFFPLSTDRRDNFVAGNSMGGYGAFLLALSQPERFAAAASLSGALDIANHTRDLEGREGFIRDAFGPPPRSAAVTTTFFTLRKIFQKKPPHPRNPSRRSMPAAVRGTFSFRATIALCHTQRRSGSPSPMRSSRKPIMSGATGIARSRGFSDGFRFGEGEGRVPSLSVGR